MECLSGKIHVWHEDIGSLIYDNNSGSQLATQNIFFYNSLYAVESQRLQCVPLPPLSSCEWFRGSLELSGACKSKIKFDINSAMKPTTGSKDVHLSWFIPFSLFAHLFGSCGVLRKTKITYQCKCPSEEWMSQLLGESWKVKRTHFDETIECRINQSDLTFR